jgi:hypothetical protein
MLVKCRFMADAGPTEAVVEIVTKEGSEEVVIQKRLVQRNALEIGNVLGTEGAFSLVELPRETTSGRWRVWVPREEVLQTA